MLNYKEIRIGERFINNHGNEFEIVDYDSTYEVTVKFTDCGYTTTTTYQYCQLGNVGSPYDKTQCGVGYLGLKKDGTKPICKINGKLTKEYKLWCGMMNRCYLESQWKHHPQYQNCSVCERWHSFANFLEDINSIPNYDKWLIDKSYEIDKDVLQPNVEFKVYSLDTCMFIPREENLQERNDRLRNRPKKEKPVKMVRAVRVTDIETGVYVQVKKQEQVGDMFGLTQSYISRLIKNEKDCFGWYNIEIVYVPESEVNQ